MLFGGCYGVARVWLVARVGDFEFVATLLQ